MGTEDTKPTNKPIIVPALQEAGIKSIVFGEYHFCMVTVYGELLTWCSDSSILFGNPFDPDDQSIAHLQFGRVPFNSLIGAACLGAAAGRGRTTLIVVSLANTPSPLRAITI